VSFPPFIMRSISSLPSAVPPVTSLLTTGADPGGDVHDAVGVDVERHPICGTRGAGGDADELKVPRVVVRYAMSLALSTLISTGGWFPSAVVKTSGAWSGSWCCGR
jgi:hypothetical protein